MIEIFFYSFLNIFMSFFEMDAMNDTKIIPTSVMCGMRSIFGVEYAYFIEIDAMNIKNIDVIIKLFVY